MTVVSLPVLKQHFVQNLDELKGNLIELIHNDYDKFLSLGLKLNGLDLLLEDFSLLIQPLDKSLSDRLETLKEKSEFLKNKMKERQKIQQEQNHIKLLLTIQESVQLIHQLLQQPSQTSSSLIRMTSSYHHLKFSYQQFLNQFPQLRKDASRLWIESIEHFGDLESVTELLGQQIEEISKDIYYNLDQKFNDCIYNRGEFSWSELLEMYSKMNGQEQAHKLLSEYFQAKLESDILVDKNEPFLSLLKFLEIQKKEFSKFFEENNLGFYFFTESLWKSIFQWMMSQLLFIFSPAIPSQFHKFFLMTNDFIKKSQEFCPNWELDYFITHSEFETFQEKFSLSAYAQLIQSQMVQKMNRIEVSLDVEQNKFPRFLLTREMKSVLDTLMSSETMLEPLLPKFIRFSIQILMKLNNMLQEVKSKLEAFEVKKSESEEEAETQKSLEIQLERVLNWAAEVNGFRNYFISLMRAQNLPDSIFVLFEEQLQNQDFFLDCIKRFFLLYCQTFLKAIKNIPSQFRRTNRPLPNEPSYFIPQLVGCFKLLNRLISDIFKKEEFPPPNWLEPLVLAFIDEYSQRINDLQQNMKEVEENLKRFERFRRDTNQVKDDDKIKHQLYLDTKEIQKELLAMKFNSETVQKALDKLLEMTPSSFE